MAGQIKTKSIEQRILEKCTELDNGCVVWNGYTFNGYGKIRWNGRRIFVHRAMYESKNGEIQKGLCACHKCDTPTCVNPDHIFIGTRADNNSDKTTKGRQSRVGSNRHGEDSHFAKLSSKDVMCIRSEYKALRTSQYALADRFKVSQSQISQIVNNKEWRSV